MNYNSIDEILSVGISNMTAIRSNTKQDDGSDLITGVDWFSFNGTVVNAIYANGNSYIGFGSNTEHLKVNRRDGAMYSLYREEGTLFGYYRFLKIRWVGYSNYSYTGSSYALTYDVILWDTGDISLHMVSIPTIANDGTYSLVGESTYAYTVSSSFPDVTFTKTDDGFVVTNSIIDLQPRQYRYLVRSGATYYTVVDDVLSEIVVDDINSEIFVTFGAENVPNMNLVSDLSNPELLCWSEFEVDKLKTGLTVYITPPLPQVVYSEAQTIPDGSIIDKAAIPSVKDILVSITFDDGQTWKYYSEGSWITASSESEGMTSDAMQNLTAEQWAEVAPYATAQFRCTLTSKESQMGKVYYNLVPITTEA